MFSQLIKTRKIFVYVYNLLFFRTYNFFFNETNMCLEFLTTNMVT